MIERWQIADFSTTFFRQADKASAAQHIARPMDQSADKVFRFDSFTVDTTRACLRMGGRDIALRPKAFAVLRHLAENAERLVAREELCRAVWPNLIVSDDSLVQCIRELRRKLGDNEHRLIKTVSRRGYLLDAAREQPTAAAPLVRGEPSEPARQLSLVVLPFQNLGGDCEQDDFADAITDDLTNGLSWLPGKVIARSTALTYKGQAIDVRQVSRDLGVRYVVEGTVRCVGDDVRVTAQLVDASTAANIWTETFDLERRDLGRLRDDVAARLASILNLELLFAQNRWAMRERPSDPTAIDLVMRAQVLLALRGGRDLSEPRRLFREALDRDDTLTAAWIGLSLSYTRYLRFSPTFQQDLSLASAAAERAMTLDPRLAWSQLAMGWVFYESKRMSQALAAFERAAQLNRNESFAHASVGAARVMLGHPEQALEPLQKAMRLSPRDPELCIWQMFMGVASLHLRRNDEAVDWLTKSIALDPSNPFTHIFLTSALALSGRENDARVQLAELLRVQPEFTVGKFRAAEPSDEPAFRMQRKQLYTGLRLAGAPE